MATHSSSSGPFGLPRFVIWGVGALVFFLLSFAAGFVVGGRPIGPLTEGMERAETRAEAADTGARELEARLHAHRALALLYRTIGDVDARNFGIANQRLDEVVSTLDRVDRQHLGTGAEEVGAIRTELAALDIRVAADLAGQRAMLSGLAQRLAEALEG